MSDDPILKCLEYHASAGGEYTYWGEQALTQSAALKANAERLLIACEGLLDMVKRDNAGFPLEYEVRVATEEYAVRAIEDLKEEKNDYKVIARPYDKAEMEFLLKENARLQAQADVDRLAEAIKPFAKLGEAMGNSRPGSTSPDSVVYGFNHAEITNADLIEARATLAAHEEAGRICKHCGSKCNHDDDGYDCCRFCNAGAGLKTSMVEEAETQYGGSNG